jgi:hypothetical protein
MPSQCCKETWNKIPDDEPVFILRGRDLLAPLRVKAWIAAAVESDVVPQDKIDGARAHYDAMIQFQKENKDRCKMPD